MEKSTSRYQEQKIPLFTPQLFEGPRGTLNTGHLNLVRYL